MTDLVRDAMLESLDGQIHHIEGVLEHLKDKRKKLERPPFKVGKIYARKGYDNDYAFIKHGNQIKIISITFSHFWTDSIPCAMVDLDHRKSGDVPYHLAKECFGARVSEFYLKYE